MAALLLDGESFLMSRRCGAASPYRGIEEVGGTPTLLETRAAQPTVLEVGGGSPYFW